MVRRFERLGGYADLSLRYCASQQNVARDSAALRQYDVYLLIDSGLGDGVPILQRVQELLLFG